MMDVATRNAKQDRVTIFPDKSNAVLLIICKKKKDPLEIQHPKFENSRVGFIESVHER